MLFSGAWGKKMIHESNLKQKFMWHCPFNKVSLQVSVLGLLHCTSWSGPYGLSAPVPQGHPETHM